MRVQNRRNVSTAIKKVKKTSIPRSGARKLVAGAANIFGWRKEKAMALAIAFSFLSYFSKLLLVGFLFRSSRLLSSLVFGDCTPHCFSMPKRFSFDEDRLRLVCQSDSVFWQRLLAREPSHSTSSLSISLALMNLMLILRMRAVFARF